MPHKISPKSTTGLRIRKNDLQQRNHIPGINYYRPAQRLAAVLTCAIGITQHTSHLRIPDTHTRTSSLQIGIPNPLSQCRIRDLQTKRKIILRRATQYSRHLAQYRHTIDYLHEHTFFRNIHTPNLRHPAETILICVSNRNRTIVQLPRMLKTVRISGNRSYKHPFPMLFCHCPSHMHRTFRRTEIIPIVDGHIEATSGAQQFPVHGTSTQSRIFRSNRGERASSFFHCLIDEAIYLLVILHMSTVSETQRLQVRFREMWTTPRRFPNHRRSDIPHRQQFGRNTNYRRSRIPHRRWFGRNTNYRRSRIPHRQQFGRESRIGTEPEKERTRKPENKQDQNRR